MKSERVEVIDSLRGLAALSVVLYHYVGFLSLLGISVGPAGSVAAALARFGHLGVPVFFVLSGFVIAMTASRYTFTTATGTRFILRRITRIAPPYWAMIALITTAIVAGHSAGFFRNTIVTPAQVIAHLVYAQEILGYTPLDVAYWTLCLEVQFYVVFAASAVLLHSRGSEARTGWLAVLTAVSLVIDTLDAVPQAWFPRLWYEFGVGVLTFSAAGDRTARFALAILLPALLGSALYRGLASGIAVPAVVVLLLLRDREWVVSPARLVNLLGLGRISYSLYLVHGLVGMGLGVWFRAGGGVRSEAASWGAIAAATAAAIAFASAFYYLCEQRAVGWAHHIQVSPKKEPANAPG